MSKVLSVSEFVTQIKNFIIANQDIITDFNDGSTLDTQIEAFATQLNRVQTSAEGKFKQQFEQIPFQVFSFNRKEETTASGTVVFSRQNADPVEIVIPVGTVVSTVGGLLYITQNEAKILSGAVNSSTANIIADTPGSEYNVLVGEVNIIVSSSTPELNAVLNNAPCTGGADKETNSKYFTRFVNYILGLQGSNTYGIFTAATTVDTIVSAYIEEHFPAISGYYSFTVHVDDGSGNVPQSKLNEIATKIKGNNTAEYQGYAAAGINFRVLSSGLVSVAVVYEIKIDAASTDPSTITSIINNAITSYIDNLWVGSDVIWSEVNKIIKQITGVLDVTNLTLNGTNANVVTTASQVPKVSTITSGTVS